MSKPKRTRPAYKAMIVAAATRGHGSRIECARSRRQCARCGARLRLRARRGRSDDDRRHACIAFCIPMIRRRAEPHPRWLVHRPAASGRRCGPRCSSANARNGYGYGPARPPSIELGHAAVATRASCASSAIRMRAWQAPMGGIVSILRLAWPRPVGWSPACRLYVRARRSRLRASALCEETGLHAGRTCALSARRRTPKRVGDSVRILISRRPCEESRATADKLYTATSRRRIADDHAGPWRPADV